MSTFIDLTNQLLRRLNEVEIAPADFPSVQGVQATAKDAIRNAIAQINLSEYEWPFNAVEHTQQLVAGQEEYSFPQYLKVADFNSFQLQADSSLDVSSTMLDFIDRDTYYRHHKDLDDDAGTDGRGVPTTVAQGFGNGYIITPSPDKAYTIRFRYYQTHTDLTAHSDTTRVPPAFAQVIIEGALVQMYMFRDNTESAGISTALFQQGIKDMQGVLINKYEAISDTRVWRRSGATGLNFYGRHF